ncbi:MAG: arsenate reductase ArsC [Bacteroidota bacterium]
MKILILCTGNSARSQMAHGILQCLNPELDVHSAGTAPAKRVKPMAIEVMKDLGIDISHHIPVNVDIYKKERWDYVLTVCDGAKESCPTFMGKVKHRIHLPFEDPDSKYPDKDHERQAYTTIRNTILLELFRLNSSTLSA